MYVDTYMGISNQTTRRILTSCVSLVLRATREVAVCFRGPARRAQRMSVDPRKSSTSRNR